MEFEYQEIKILSNIFLLARRGFEVGETEGFLNFDLDNVLQKHLLVIEQYTAQLSDDKLNRYLKISLNEYDRLKNEVFSYISNHYNENGKDSFILHLGRLHGVTLIIIERIISIASQIGLALTTTTQPTTTPQNIGVERGNGVPNYISLTTQQITDSYELFKETALSNTNISDYFKCWDLNEPNPPEIVFGHNFATQFHYFLSKIEGVNAELALKRFGINNFNQVKNKHNPEPNLKNEIGRILEKKNIVKVN